jgi:hypothetical protein
MQTARTLRTAPAPDGQKTLNVVGPGDEVTILQESQAWAQIQIAGSEVTGWVQKDTIGDTSPVPPDPDIDPAAFFRMCWLRALDSQVYPNYLAAVAKARSGIKNDTQNNQIGPFRFQPPEWDADRRNAALKLTDLGANDVHAWAYQCAMFAATTAQAFAALQTALGRPSSAHELYLAQLIGAKAAAAAITTPANTIKAALDGVQDADLPAGGLTRDQVTSRYSKYLLDPGPPPASVTGQVALDRIATDLQAAIDAVKDGIVAAGTEILGTSPEDSTLAGSATTPGGPSSGGTTFGNGGPSGISGAGGPLGQLIARGESGARGYNAYNRGFANQPAQQIDFSTMSLGQVVAAQSRAAGDPNRLFAVGKYQIIPSTMRDAIARLQLSSNRMFTPDLQETLFRDYLIAIKRPQVKAFITGAGSGSLVSAELALALEFASVADPNTGRSHYGGSGGNRASISVAETAAALNSEKGKYSQSIAAGQTAANAWDGLSK